MPEGLLTAPGALPVTHLSEDENLFQQTVRQFAREAIQPLVRKMDDEQHFADGLVPQLFQLGLMGIEVPEEFGGAGGTFFQAILAVEEISAVDPSVGVLVDVQNTLCVNALVRWGNAEQKKRFLPKLAADTVCSYALSEASSGSPMRMRLAYLSSSRPLTARPATRASLRFSSNVACPASASARKKTSWASARRRPAN
jgi:butyryl-CoA dehydrogenase/short/branched chain acyl-CoA dehydrogenase